MQNKPAWMTGIPLSAAPQPIEEEQAQPQPQPEQQYQPPAGPNKPAWMSGTPLGEEKPPDVWQQTQYNFKVRPFVLANGKPSVQRDDGAIWMGKDQGYSSEGWFMPAGERTGNVPGQEAPPSTGETVLKNVLYNPLTMGATDFLAKGLQFGANAIPGVPKDWRDVINENITAREVEFGKLPMNQTFLAGINRGIGQQISTLPFGGAVGAANPALVGLKPAIQRGASSMPPMIPAPVVPLSAMAKQGVAVGAKEGALYSAMTPNALPEGATPQDFAKAQIAPMAEGALGGGLIGGAAPIIGKKIIQPIGRGLGIVTSYLPTAMKELQYIADRHNIPISASILDKTLAKTEDAVSHIPGSGMTEYQIDTRNKAHEAAERLVESLKYRVSGKVKGGTASEMSMLQGRSNQAENLAIGHQLYEAEAKIAGDKEVDYKKTIKAIDDEIHLNSLKNRPDIELHNELEFRKKRLLETPEDLLPKDRNVIPFENKDLNGNVSQIRVSQFKRDGLLPKQEEALITDKNIMDKTYQGTNELRSEFWKEAKKYKEGSPKYALYNKLAQAVEEDMEGFVENSDNQVLKGLHDVARNWWRTKVKNYSPDSFEYAQWAKQLKGRDLEPEKVMDSFIQANNDGKAKYFYNGLDEDGRAAVRWGIMQDALAKSTAKDTKTFSPALFATYMKNNQEAVGVFFRGKDKLEIDGFTKLMRAIEDVGSAGYVPKTGKASIFPGFLAAQGTALGGAVIPLAMGHPGIAAMEAAGSVLPSIAARISKNLMTTKAGKRILLEISVAKPGTPAMEAALSKIPAVMGSTLSSEANKNTEAEYQEMMRKRSENPVLSKVPPSTNPYSTVK